MPKFAVVIEGEGLDQVREALDRAEIPTLGPPFSKFVAEPDDQTHVGRRMAALVDADSPEAAEGQVRANLPEGDYRVASRHWG
jgi:hypothetical protein